MSNDDAADATTSTPGPESRVFPTAWRIINEPLRVPIYHYTDQRGFLGIVQSRAVWATDLRYLNDRREYTLGYERIAAGLRARTRGKGTEVLIEGVLDSLRQEQVPGLRVASFSQARDDLSQWRAYGGGSGGLCIGFEPEEFERRVRQTGSWLARIRYRPDEQLEIVDALCEEIVTSLNEVVHAGEPIAAFAGKCQLSVQAVAAVLKESAFEAEAEWRLVAWWEHPPAVTAGIRPGRSMLLPYVAVRLDYSVKEAPDGSLQRLPLTSVVVGPTPHPDLAVNAVQQALADAGQAAEVRSSDVPFRNW